ncbi:hypothetical protein TUM17576_39150 [Enterobacter hormaechei]|uniref:NrsF family protein n=1 Tax=Phytobacter ursingii TaxID=1972431 RepID=A0AB35RRU7_9ENTR|nr:MULTISPECIES: NrsF family protein [Enterobacteriaceae]MDV2864321.1 NrsF family protein [Phytobacter ursingii]GJL37095.1 hypothetical protein TUM17576_39150 [Enterobacter hormaechei]
MADHDLFIEQLSRTIEPVKRPWQPGWRVVAWIVMALPCGALASLLVHRTFTDWSQTGAAWVIFQLFLTFLTGTLAIRNAFLLSIAGQQYLSWKWFAPLVSLWLVITFTNMRLHHLPPVQGNEVGTNCYLFMVVVSVPMMAIVIGYLRRTRTLFPARSLAAAGAGVACMALTLLALCHPTHVSALDFLMHISATATIVLGTMALGYKWVSLPRP